MQPLPEEARREAAEDAQWSRPECQVWTGTLLLGTCLLYCARVSMPVCAAAMSQDFGWNKKEAGVVLSSFFWGYCLTQVVGGHLGDRIGGEKVILLSASAWGFITAATPLLSRLSSAHLAFMTFSRILTGLLQGVYFPALTSLLSQKVRESERAFTYSTVGAGSQFGTLVTGAVGSLLLDWYGWPSVFYFSGGLTLLWVCYVYRCLLGEKDLILALGVLAQGLPVSRHTKVPWRQLFRKPSVWAAIISQLSAACSFFILLSWLPTFFKETFPSSKGWVFNVVPWLVAIPASLFSGLLSDRLINQGASARPRPWEPSKCTGSYTCARGSRRCRGCPTASPARPSSPRSLRAAVRVGPTLGAVWGGTAQMGRQDVSWSPRLGYRTITVRKFMQAMGLGLSSVFALCLGHTSSFCKSVVFASASIGLQTFNHSGISVNIQDLAPSCAGFLFGVANTAGALAGCRSRGRVPGWLPHRDHGLLDVCVRPGGGRQQPRAMHLPGVREGPAGGPEPRP
ncbi:solute carrier family 17 member 9 isoform X2 [Orcinus orca]|uniref:solute carrier family 17 member 9 isoform X2 n=1 Tax=Orcinus orca TaxID=9733 RepID=UPI002111FFF6|nr:solute carrier family 17 member 9 isoform X2 [Orcinus orca]